MIADSNKFKFKNNTGGKITITSEVRSNSVYTHTSHLNKVLKDGESVEYVVTPAGDGNTFRYYGSTLKIHYKTEGNETGVHTIGVARLETCNPRMPNTIQVSFAFGVNGLPRMHILRKQGGKYNGQPFYMDDKSIMKLYFEWDNTSLAGKELVTTPMSWRIDYHGQLMARHEGISKKSSVTNEDIVWGFPLDCSYYGNITTLQSAKKTWFAKWTHAVYTETPHFDNMYRTWHGIGGHGWGESGWGADKLRYVHIAYRDAVSFTNLSASDFDKVKSSSSMQDIIHIPFGGTDKNASDGANVFPDAERTYELNTGTGSNTYPDNVLYEWEVVTAPERFNNKEDDIKPNIGHRFVTQYSKFTINLDDMGLSGNKRGTDRNFGGWSNNEYVDVRFRTLGHLSENKSGANRKSSASEGRIGTWSTWKSIPRMGWIEGPAVRQWGGKYWIEGKLGSVFLHSGNSEKILTETDCGWDGRLVVRVTTTDDKTDYWHPMVSVNSKLTLGTNKNHEPILVQGAYYISFHYHNGLDWEKDYETRSFWDAGRGIDGLGKRPILTTPHAPTYDPAVRLRDSSYYRGHAEDSEVNHNAKGTFKLGYECCEVDLNTDLKASGFMFDIHTQKCCNFDWKQISLDLNGAWKTGESITHWNRGEMGHSYGDGANVANSELNGFRSSNVDFRMDNGPDQTRLVDHIYSVSGTRKGDERIYKSAGQGVIVPNMELIGLRNVTGIDGGSHNGWHVGGNDAGGYWVGGDWGGGVPSGGTRAAYQAMVEGTYLSHNTYRGLSDYEDVGHFALCFYSTGTLGTPLPGVGRSTRKVKVCKFSGRFGKYCPDPYMRLHGIKGLRNPPGGSDSHDRSTIHFNNPHPTKTVKLKFGFVGSVSTDDHIYYGLQCWDVTNNKWIYKLPTAPQVHAANSAGGQYVAVHSSNHYNMNNFKFPGSNVASVVMMRGTGDKYGLWLGKRYDWVHSFNYVWSIPPKTHYKFGLFGVMDGGANQIEYGGWRWWGCNVISGY